MRSEDYDEIVQAQGVEYVTQRAREGLLTEAQATQLLDALHHADCVSLDRARAAVDREARTLNDLAGQARDKGELERARGLEVAAYHVRRWLNGYERGCVVTVFDRRRFDAGVVR